MKIAATRIAHGDMSGMSVSSRGVGVLVIPGVHDVEKRNHKAKHDKCSGRPDHKQVLRVPEFGQHGDTKNAAMAQQFADDADARQDCRVADAVGQAIGFGLALCSIAVVREILGTGMLAGIRVLPASWPSWTIMVLPPGAFLTFGLLLGLINWIDSARSQKKR